MAKKINEPIWEVKRVVAQLQIDELVAFKNRIREDLYSKATITRYIKEIDKNVQALEKKIAKIETKLAEKQK